MPQFVKKQQYPNNQVVIEPCLRQLYPGNTEQTWTSLLFSSLHLYICLSSVAERNAQSGPMRTNFLIKNACDDKSSNEKKIIEMLYLVHLPLSSGYSTSNIVHRNHMALRGLVKANHPFEEDILLPSTQPKGCNSTLLTGQLMYSLRFKLVSVSVQVKFDNTSCLFTTYDVKLMHPFLCNLTSNSKKSCWATTPLISQEYLPVYAIGLHASLYL